MTKTHSLIIAAVGSLIALGAAEAMGPKEGMEKCYGVVKAGKNDCGANAHGCAGMAKVDGDPNEWLSLPKGTCERIVGGSLTPGSRATAED
jgi:uncharacterized membrane protein